MRNTNPAKVESRTEAWLEIISDFPERVGKYLVCPVFASTGRPFGAYDILEDINPGDIIFHCLSRKAARGSSVITSYSFAVDKPHISTENDPLCTSAPPLRIVDLSGHRYLNQPIFLTALKHYRSQIHAASLAIPRTPFDKNFKLKQMYLARVPRGYLPIFSLLSATKLI
jgi:hypothetical protein